MVKSSMTANTSKAPAITRELMPPEAPSVSALETSLSEFLRHDDLVVRTVFQRILAGLLVPSLTIVCGKAGVLLGGR